MINFSKYKCIFWDFDGVLMDSMPVRAEGFRKTLLSYPASEVELLLEYHRKNGGLSRYHKFRYFFEVIRGQSIEEEQILKLAGSFSEVMMELLINEKLLIRDSLDFVKKYWESKPMHIVSGSDGVELNEICRRLDIARYFRSIHGSPTPKDKLISELINSHKYRPEEIVLIGDSINDYEAALVNKIDFMGYNNIDFHKMEFQYITSFEYLQLHETGN